MQCIKTEEEEEEEEKKELIILKYGMFGIGSFNNLNQNKNSLN